MGASRRPVTGALICRRPTGEAALACRRPTTPGGLLLRSAGCQPHRMQSRRAGGGYCAVRLTWAAGESLLPLAGGRPQAGGLILPLIPAPPCRQPLRLADESSPTGR